MGVERWASAVAVIATLSLAPAAWAQEAEGRDVLHRVRDSSETYAALSEHYYGKKGFELHLRIYNRREEPLAPGTTLIIPTHRLVALKQGETLGAFAERHLSDSARAAYLTELHQLGERPPRPGARLRVPPSLPHVVRSGESLESIALLYYRDGSRRRVELLRLFNKRPSAAVSPRTAIRIPLDHDELAQEAVRARAAKPLTAARVLAAAPPPVEEPAKREDPKKKAGRREAPERPALDPAAVEAELAAARQLFDDGDYASASARARRARSAAGDAPAPLRVALLELEASAQVALGKYPEAKRTFQALLRVAPRHELDPVETSPKILDVFAAVAER